MREESEGGREAGRKEWREEEEKGREIKRNKKEREKKFLPRILICIQGLRISHEANLGTMLLSEKSRFFTMKFQSL